MPILDEEQTRKPTLPFIQRHPILLCLFMIIGLLLTLLAVATWWYNSDRDLQVAKQFAVKHGVPTTNADFKPQRMSEALRDRVEELNELLDSEDFLDYESHADEKDITYDSELRFLPGSSVHPKVKEYYQTEAMQKNIALILSVIKDYNAEGPYITGYSLLDEDYDEYPCEIGDYFTYVVEEYALLIEGEELNRLIKTLLHYINIERELSYEYGWKEAELIQMTARIMSRNPGQMDEEIVELLEQAIDSAEQHIYGYFLREVAAIFDQSSFNPITYNYEFWDDPEDALRFRLQRKEWIMAVVQASVEQKTPFESYAKYQQHRPTTNNEYIEMLYETNDDYVYYILEATALAKLLIHEFRQEKWPKELKVKPIVVDGHLLGAYSFGYDEVDDGWELEDTCYWLYGCVDKEGKVLYQQKVPYPRTQDE